MRNMLASARRLAALHALPLALSAFCAAAPLTAPVPTYAADAPAPANLPFVSPLFTDNMVLQRGRPVVVWGWTAPGRTVTVRIAGKSATGVADAQGKWTVKLPALPVGGPYTMDVSHTAPNLTAQERLKPRGPYPAGLISTGLRMKNILVGDVWVCSGQSNMEFGLGNVVNAAQEIASADYPQIRLYTVQRDVADTPRQIPSGKWDVCTPQTVPVGGWNGFSAVGYYFGRELYKNLKVPIGLIHTSWGGTPAEAWTSAQALETLPDYRAQVAQIQQRQRAATAASDHSFAEQMFAWYSQNDPGARGKWDGNGFDDSDWKTINAPGAWEQSGIAEFTNFDGIAWFRKEFDLPAGAESKDCVLHLGAIDDRDTTWVNGTPIGGMDDYNANRAYPIPRGVLKPGKNVVAVRVLDTGGAGGFVGRPEQMYVTVPGGPDPSLAGAWKYKIAAPLADTKPVPMPAAAYPNAPAVLYNGMIAPLLPYGIKGAIWYQGESNAGKAYQYRSLLPAMIEDWRAGWHEGSFPFYIVQLANYQQSQPNPTEDAWAELREAQSMTAAHLPNTGIAVTIDIGDANDIHPKNKQEVGRRLALAALAQTYGEKIEYSGPQYKSMKIEDGKIRLAFTHTGGGLTVKDGPKLTGFAVAGDDHKFAWADARIEGNTIVVSSSQVSKPVAVRYAWAINPVCNLYNQAGLPASPFRTDDWPGVTVNSR